MKAAFEWLRKRGAAKASDLEGREAAEGLVAVVATDNEAAVLQVCRLIGFTRECKQRCGSCAL